MPSWTTRLTCCTNSLYSTVLWYKLKLAPDAVNTRKMLVLLKVCWNFTLYKGGSNPINILKFQSGCYAHQRVKCYSSNHHQSVWYKPCCLCLLYVVLALCTYRNFIGNLFFLLLLFPFHDCDCVSDQTSLKKQNS